MKIVIAPNSFKDCLNASDAATAIEKGVLNVLPDAQTVKISLADGGDGLISALASTLGANLKEVSVNGPDYRAVKAKYAVNTEKKLAIIEMAAASGLALLKERDRNASITTSYGTGQLIKDAIESGCNHILLGLGGSATNDTGMGILSALGYRFLDKKEIELAPIGLNLSLVSKIDSSKKLHLLDSVKLEVICDVDNPLYGPTGAAYVYARQKGASDEEIKKLDDGLRNFSEVVFNHTGIDISQIKGGGAAGGISAGLYGLLNAKLRPGIELILDIVDFKTKLKGASLVITGEGKIDSQSQYGKVPPGVGRISKAKHIPCVAIAGKVDNGISCLHECGITAIFSLCPGPLSLEKAISNAPEYLEKISEQIVRLFVS